MGYSNRMGSNGRKNAATVVLGLLVALCGMAALLPAPALAGGGSGSRTFTNVDLDAYVTQSERDARSGLTPDGLIKHCSKYDSRRCVLKRASGGVVELFFEQSVSFPVTVTLDATLKNMRADVPLPLTVVVPDNKRVRLLSFMRINPGKQDNYNYTFWTRHGSRDARHNDAYLYHLPYADGAAWRVSQGFNGSFSHQENGGFKVDFTMPEGTPIHAAREGMVVAVQMSGILRSDDRQYATEGNTVYVQHDDGTVALYVHFAFGSIFAQAGRRVMRGDVLGLSGNTGFSTGPHLHFEVGYPKDGRTWQTVPVRFSSGRGEVTAPLKGERYVAVP